MTRIIAGTAGGRRLLVPRGEATRPTSDRVREALFAALEARGLVQGARVMDLFCGSGALGLEAISRGATEAVLVDVARPALEAARRNAATLQFAPVNVVLSPVQKYLDGRPAVPADLVFADPPYPLGEDELAALLASLGSRGWLADEATVVVERSGRSPEPQWPAGMHREAVRRYGETSVWQAVWDRNVPEPGDAGS